MTQLGKKIKCFYYGNSYRNVTGSESEYHLNNKNMDYYLVGHLVKIENISLYDNCKVFYNIYNIVEF